MDQRDPQDAPPRPLGWRDPELWLVVGPPLAAVLGGIVTLWLAITHADPLVSATVRKAGVVWQDPAAAPATRRDERPDGDQP
jgi:hypothetical protein